ncbi:MAG: response regulator transcription factor [Lachnospiraceae bacterium]|nr:response regulator transcription factor [Lachnospiraceae bacterium]
MKEFRVAVLDSRKEDLENTCAVLEEIAKGQEIRMKVFKTRDAEDLLYELEEKRYDFYILDIGPGERGGMDGFAAAEEIRKRDRQVPIVFLAHSAKGAIRGYDVDAHHYLLKSDYREKLAKIVRKLYGRWKEASGRMVLKTFRGGWEAVMREEICYVQAEGRQCRVCLKERDFYIGRNLRSLKEELGEDFCYVRKNCLINVRNVKGRQGDVLLMENGDMVAVSRNYKKDLHFM